MEHLLVIITKKHTQDTTFDSWRNCALVKAIRQQYPELKIIAAFDEYVLDKNNRHYHFDNADATGYSRISFSRLKSGAIREIAIQLTELRPAPIEKQTQQQQSPLALEGNSKN